MGHGDQPDTIQGMGFALGRAHQEAGVPGPILNAAHPRYDLHMMKYIDLR